jgi:hypothetical protein
VGSTAMPFEPARLRKVPKGAPIVERQSSDQMPKSLRSSANLDFVIPPGGLIKFLYCRQKTQN